MNFEILGIGIAVTFAIIALSAITLYLAFRVKETFREEKGLKIQLVKTFFLIGMLFLASGMFYYFAQAMSPEKADNTSKMIENEAVSESGIISLGLAYPENVRVNDNYNITFAVKSSAPHTIHNATIKITGLPLFGAKSNFGIEVDKLNLGDLQPGETDGFLQLKAPSYPIVLVGTMLLSSQDTDTVTQNIRINIIDTITSSPTPTPIINATVNKTPPHFDGTLISSSKQASSRNPAQTATPTPTATANQTVAPETTATANQTATPTPIATANQTATPAPTTPAPTNTPEPTTPAPTTPAPTTPAPTTPEPTAPEPTTPAPTTPAPTAPEPTTPAPTTPAPTAPEPTTPAPTTPAPTTPAPTAPEPTTPAPTAPEPTTPPLNSS